MPALHPSQIKNKALYWRSRECPPIGPPAIAEKRGYTRGDTHTQMRSMTHYVRSNTPGNNVFSGVSCIRNSASYERDDPMSLVTIVFSWLWCRVWDTLCPYLGLT